MTVFKLTQRKKEERKETTYFTLLQETLTKRTIFNFSLKIILHQKNGWVI